MYSITLTLIFLPMIVAIIIFLVQNEKFNKVVFALQSLNIILIGFLIREVIFLKSPILFTVGPWDYRFGIEILIDPLALIFILMTNIAFWYIFLYSWATKKSDTKFLLLLLFLQSSLSSVFMVHDLFSFFVLVDLSAIICSILILYKKDGKSMRASIYYLLFNGLAMSLFLLGVLLLYVQCGSVNMTVIKEYLANVPISLVTKVSFSLFIISLGIKSGFFPVFSWLPIAHSAAPTAISALLSGLMVKIGFYGLLRMQSTLALNGFLNWYILVIALVTAFVGVILAIMQSDIKRILAYHTVSQIGLISISLSSASDYAYYGGLLHSFNHFLFKSLLFLAVGFLIETVKERNIKRYRALFSLSPFLSICIMIGILSISGAPLTVGSISKSLLLKGSYPFNITPFLYLLNLGTFISFFKYFRAMFGHTTKKISINIGIKLALGLLSSLLIVLYPLEYWALAKFTTLNFYFSWVYLLKEIVIYLLYFIGSLLFYKYVHLDSKALTRISKLNLDFPSTNFALIIFWIITIIVSF